MSIDRSLAHFLVHRRRAGFLLLGAILALAGLLLWKCLKLDTEILNLLPSGYDAVETLKTYNRDFQQTRELTFAVHDETKQTDLDGFTEEFANRLKGEEWVERVLASSPMESPDGLADIQKIALPLLFNLPAADFESAISSLTPAAIAARLHRFQEDISSGSPRAEMQLQLDPLGIVVPALKPLANSFSAEQTQPLASKDGTLRLVMVMTTQTDLGPKACQALMREITAMRAKMIADWQSAHPGPMPEILVTGRTPFVAEISKGMEFDITITALSSITLVSLIFYLGFRRFKPLIVMVHVVLFCCVIALTVGAVMFPALNGITIGFCSILVGIAVDFGMLVYSSYQTALRDGLEHEDAIAAALRKVGRSVIFGALITGIGFLALLFSGAAGFSQFGALIAFGLFAAALSMMTLLFLLLGREKTPPAPENPNSPVDHWLAVAGRHPIAIIGSAFTLLALLTTFALLPVGRIQFQGDPRSLEPSSSQAGVALRTIQAKMTEPGSEPLLAIIQSPDDDTAHDFWARSLAYWQGLQAKGVLKSASTPAAFVVAPKAVAANAEKIRALNFPALRAAFTQALDAEGFAADSFAGGFTTLDQLAAIAKGDRTPLDWHKNLPATSSWWFMLDKFFGNDPNTAVAYITPARIATTPAEADALRAEITPPGVPVHFSGWGLVLTDLKPWAHDKLIALSCTMFGLNLLVLIVLFRRATSVLLLVGAIALAIGAMLATIKLTHVPLNLFNALAFPLVFSVGIDYGIYILLAARNAKPGGPTPREALRPILKPVMLSALTSIAGFGSLAWATNPSLSGIGIVGAIGLSWSLFATLFIVVPICLRRAAR